MRLATVLAILLALTLLATTATARTWYILPDSTGDAPTIQAGIDSAVAGDTVLVADGTYMDLGNRDLDFHDKPIVVRSENGPGFTIVDCDSSGRGFYFHSGESPGSKLEGFTIQNGSAGKGSGIKCDSASSPTITNCIIRENTASEDGGGIYCWNSSPRLTYCTITRNEAGEGGGLYCDDASFPEIKNCTIDTNTANYNGGGIFCFAGSSPNLRTCTIMENTAINGAGVYCVFSPLTMNDCNITENTASENGGGVYGRTSSLSIDSCNVTQNIAYNFGGGIFLDTSISASSYPSITNCTLNGNTAYNYGGGCFCVDSDTHASFINCIIINNATLDGGGGFCCWASYLNLTNCAITENEADYGGGIYCWGSYASMSLINCTIDSNAANWDGGGIYCDGHSPTVKNCILWDDLPQEIYVESGNPSVTYSDVEGGWSGTGNINCDPLFVTGPKGSYYLSQETAGQFQTSCCVDSGDPSSPLIEGTTRTDEEPDTGVVDMGYHYSISMGPPPDPIDDLKAELIARLDYSGKSYWGHVYLSWSEPYDDEGVDHYLIYRSTNPYQLGNFLASTTDTFHLDIGAVGNPIINYYYTVKAVDVDGNKSEESNKVGEFDKAWFPAE